MRPLNPRGAVHDRRTDGLAGPALDEALARIGASMDVAGIPSPVAATAMLVALKRPTVAAATVRLWERWLVAVLTLTPTAMLAHSTACATVVAVLEVVAADVRPATGTGVRGSFHATDAVAVPTRQETKLMRPT